MIVKNLMESKVLQLSESYLKSLNKKSDTKLFSDIVAYTLNRVAPQYVSSSRGFLNKTFSNEGMQISADIHRIIDEAYQMVQRRDADKLDDTLPTITENGYYAIHPLIIGNIFYSSNFSRVENGTITAYKNGQIIKNYSSSFPNPFSLSPYTPGRYIFGFEPEVVEDDSVLISHITLVSSIDGFEKHSTNITLEIECRYYTKSMIPLFSHQDVDNIYIS